MKNDYFMFKKLMFITLIFSFLNFQTIYSQCTNPTPTGNAIQDFCKTDNRTIADLNTNGGTIVWYNSSTGGEVYNNNELLINGTYYADDISNNSCSTSRLAVTVNIYGDVPEDVNVFVGKCGTQNATIGDLSATGTNIEWYDAQVDGNLLPSTHLLEDNTTYWVQQTENGCTSSRLPTQVTIIDPPAPSTTTNQSFCSADSPTVSDLQASTTSLLWYDTETSTIPLEDTTPLIDGEDYWVVENSFPCESSTRNRTVVAIDEAPNAGTSNEVQICESELTTIDLYTELGGTPDIDGVWTGPSDLGGGYLGSFDPDVNVEGIYTYTVTSNLEVCSPAIATINFTILKPQPPSISQATQTFCINENATVADLSIDTDVNWYAEENSTTPLNATDALTDGEDYWAAQVDSATGCESALRAVINVIIENPEPPTITNTTQQFCEIDNATVNDLAATGDNITWYDDESATTPIDGTTALVNGQVYWASTTSTTGCEGANRNSVTVNIIQVTPPTVSIINQEFCAIDNATIGNLTATGNSIVWYEDENATTPLTNDTPLINGEDYWATQTNSVSGCESVSRTVVNVTINDVTPPSTATTTQTYCLPDLDPNVPTIADLDISGNAVVWYDTETSTTPLDDTEVLVNGEDYWATQTDTTTGCESSVRTKIDVILLNPTPPTTTNVTQVFCVVDNATVANLDVSGDNIVWFDNENSTIALSADEVLVNGEDYWAEANDSSNSCTSNFRLRVTVNIEDSAPVTITNSTQSFCTSSNSTVNDLEATGVNVQWYDTETSTTPLALTDVLVDGEDYWASQLNANGCLSSVRNVVNVTLNDPGTPNIIANGNEFCVIDNPTLADLNVRVSANNSNSTIVWYNSYPNGSELSLSEMLTEGSSYFAVEVNEDDCTSTLPLEVVVTLESCDEYDIETYDGFSPNGNSINETFTIKNLRELYPEFKVEFYNRWGKLVYETNANKPDWNGRLNGDGVLVPAGVYYYIIYFNKNNKKPIQKKLYLNR